MGPQQYCLRWNNHQSNMLSMFDNLYSSESLVDVTLACEGVSLKAHKVVLSACSSFFQDIFVNNPCKHPVVILKDMKLDELRAVLQFMYKGQVNVTQNLLPRLVKSAESLKIKGLAEMTSSQIESIKAANLVGSATTLLQARPVVKSQHVINHVPVKSTKLNSYAIPSTESQNANDRTALSHHDILTEDDLENCAESPKDEPTTLSHTESHPQLSALLDTTIVKRQPPSPTPSDTLDDESFVGEPNPYSSNDNLVDGGNSLMQDDEMSEDSQTKNYSIVPNSNDDLTLTRFKFGNDDGSFTQGKPDGILSSTHKWYSDWRSKRKRYKRYTQQSLEMAIATVMDGKLSQKRAAVTYGIPHETLRRHIKDRKDYPPSLVVVDETTTTSQHENDLYIVDGRTDDIEAKAGGL
ncbi:Uncharacterised protein g7923 [Pycnogonum litorale]